MKDGRKWPEIFVDINFIHRSDIINKLLRVDQEIFNINYDHPVLGQVVEVFKIVDNKTMVLKSVYPVEYQEGIDQIDIVKDYYNNFILDGHETYLEYYNSEVGYFLLSRNVKETQGVF
jgi:hypothetical protein